MKFNRAGEADKLETNEMLDRFVMKQNSITEKAFKNHLAEQEKNQPGLITRIFSDRVLIWNHDDDLGMGSIKFLLFLAELPCEVYAW